MKARILTQEGIDQFTAQLAELRANSRGNLAEELLDDPALSVPYPHEIKLPRLSAETARYVWGYTALALLDGREPAAASSVGFWSWLAVYYFDVLCPPGASGKRKVGQTARYVPGTDFRTYYRHLLLSPWFVCRAHRDDPQRARAVLAGPLHSPGNVAEQVISRQELVTCGPFMEALVKLYIDPTTGRLKPGAGDSARSKRGGGVERLVTFTKQLSLTFDMNSMSADQLISKLPTREYGRFLPTGEHS